jgi:hypothetical protein
MIVVPEETRARDYFGAAGRCEVAHIEPFEVARAYVHALAGDDDGLTYTSHRQAPGADRGEHVGFAP